MNTPALPPTAAPKHRYKLDERLEKHPWRKSINRMSRQLEPDWHSVRGIKDTQTGEWHTEPREKKPVHFLEVRRLNGMPPLTPQKVRGVLKKAGIEFSTSHTTRIRGWHSTTSGATVWQADNGAISVGYVFHHWAKERQYHAMLAPALAALRAAGLNPTQHDDGRIEL